MKLLVLVADYPNNDGGVALMYVHTRNKYYVEKGIELTVLNFAATDDYIYDGIQVISLITYKNNLDLNYDILVLHAANIRNHYLFLKKYQRRFKKKVFFFHGHEILMINKVYSKPYSFIKQNYIKKTFQDVYDTFKLIVWKNYFIENRDSLHFVFVSKWMYEEFLKWTKVSPSVLEGRYDITYNCVGKYFEDESYDISCNKEYDFITIRGYMDGSKYAIDIVNELARANPNYRFLIVGKGSFFNYYEKADNITWLDTYLNHNQIIYYLNKSRCALMPTRTDAQGLMMCEMATFGIPVITSDISVCHEVFDNFANVEFINNNDVEKCLNDELSKLSKYLPYEKNNSYFNENTSSREIRLFEKLLQNINEEQG